MYEDFEFPFENLTVKDEVSFELEKSLICAVKRCLQGNGKCAVSFSGGLDSSIVAKVLKDLGVDFTAYVAGLKGSEDITFAKRIADELGLNLKVIAIKQQELEALIKAVTWITKSNDPVTVEVAMMLYTTAKEAAKDGYKIIFSGLGSDEIFAGYGSHAKALLKGWSEVHKECILRVHSRVNRDIARDVSICRTFNIEPVMPFMDIDVVRLAMSIHPQLKINPEQKKLVLRKVAKQLNLPQELCERKKRAAQYGSGIDKALRMAAKQAGFKSIPEYISSVSKVL